MLRLLFCSVLLSVASLTSASTPAQPLFQEEWKPSRPLPVARTQDQWQGVYRLHSTSCVVDVGFFKKCQRYQGSCVLIHQDSTRTWFLTATHVLHDNNQVEINGHHYPVQREADLPLFDGADGASLLSCSADLPRLPYYRLSTREPSVGEKVWLLGFPHGRQQGRASLVTAVSRHGFDVERGFLQGASGGAALFADGTIAGLIHFVEQPGSGDQLCSYGSQLHRSLSRSRWADPLRLRGPPQAPLPTQPDPTPSLPPQEPVEPSESPQETPHDPLESAVPPEQPAPQTPPPSVEPETRTTVPEAPASTPADSASPPRSLASTLIERVPWDLLLALALGGPLAGLGAWGGWKFLSFIPKVLKGLKLLKGGRRSPSPGFLSRDESEVEQILSLRQQENRAPLQDAFYGVLFEDEYNSNPDQTLREAWDNATRRFNLAAPLSTKDFK